MSVQFFENPEKLYLNMFIQKISRVLIFLYTASAKIEVFWNDSLVLGEIDLQQGQFWTLFAQAAGEPRGRRVSRDMASGL